MALKFTSVLFDLDGTLLHTADDLGAAMNYVLRQHGKPQVSPLLYTPEASNGAKAMLQLGFGDSFAEYDFDTLRSQFLTHYVDHIAHHTTYFAQVVKTLTFLNENNIPWGIVTNKPTYLTTPLLTHFPLLENCHIVVSGDTVGVSKPDPKPMLHALDGLNPDGNLDAAHCLYVGDAERDIAAGKNAGMPTAAALYGYINSGEDISRWGADYHFTSLGALSALF